MEFTVQSFLAAAGAITLRAVLQASTGLGAGLVVVPLLALISVQLVPGPVIFASLALTVLMSYRGRRGADSPAPRRARSRLRRFLGTYSDRSRRG